MPARRKPVTEKALTITVSVSVDMLDLIERAAERNAVSRSEYIRQAIKIKLATDKINNLREVCNHAD